MVVWRIFMKQHRRILKVILGSFFTLLLGAMMIAVVLFFLGSYLFRIQMPERLRYVKDYTDFVLEVEPVNNCKNQIYSLFQYENDIYTGICVSNVFVKYGNTKAPLEYVLNQNYISLKDLKKKLYRTNDKTELEEYYEYRRSGNELENYRVTIIPKNYQSGTIQEISFEKYLESKN